MNDPIKITEEGSTTKLNKQIITLEEGRAIELNK